MTDDNPLRAELHDIMQNPQNPLHAGYHKADPAVMKQIDEKYAKAYGTAPVNLGDGITTGPRDEPEPEPLEVVGAEDVKENEAMVTALKSEWGNEFAAKNEDAKHGLLEIERVYGREGAEQMLEDYLAEGGTRAEAMRFLARRGASIKKGATR